MKTSLINTVLVNIYKGPLALPKNELTFDVGQSKTMEYDVLSTRDPEKVVEIINALNGGQITLTYLVWQSTDAVHPLTVRVSQAAPSSRLAGGTGAAVQVSTPWQRAKDNKSSDSTAAQRDNNFKDVISHKSVEEQKPVAEALFKDKDGKSIDPPRRQDIPPVDIFDFGSRPTAENTSPAQSILPTQQ